MGSSYSASKAAMNSLAMVYEGDIIRIFRQAIDVMEQVRRATDSEPLREKLTGSIHLLDKEVVAVSFE